MAYQAHTEKSDEGIYIVRTNAPQMIVSQIAVYIYTEWVKFATGRRTLEGKEIMNPTGKYASSIRVERRSENEVAVIADPSIAKEANYLEFGHKEYDMKLKFKGRTFPIHRAGGVPFQKGVKIPGYYASFTSRSNDFTGYAKVGDKGWVIPEMKAYHPAMSLAHLAEMKLKSMS